MKLKIKNSFGFIKINVSYSKIIHSAGLIFSFIIIVIFVIIATDTMNGNCLVMAGAVLSF